MTPEKVDYKEWHKKCRDFYIFFDGYLRGDTTPQRKIIKLFTELEKIVFGKTKTQSWAI